MRCQEFPSCSPKLCREGVLPADCPTGIAQEGVAIQTPRKFTGVIEATVFG
jgi:hypothetical protein